jgi:hypothetical protein
MQRVKQTLAEREKRNAIPLLSPKEFTAAIESDHDRAVVALDQRAERYLDAAVQSWLPLAYGAGDSSQATPAEARRALEYLAEILETRHDDAWLYDFLQSRPDAVQKEALHALTSGDEALHTGRYGLALELAQKSMRDFQRSGNRAGMLRAAFAVMLAQTVVLKSNEALATADRVLPLLKATRYRWLQVQILIQRGECLYGVPRVEEAIRSTYEGIQLARQFQYSGLELRATSFLAAKIGRTGGADRGFRDLIGGLATFWKSDVGNVRGDNLYTTFFLLAGDRNWHRVEAFAIAEDLLDFPREDPVDEAGGWEFVAEAQEESGDHGLAQATLRRVEEQLSHLPEDSGIALSKAAISLDGAEIQIVLGDAKGAAATLAGLQQQFAAMGSGLIRVRYYKAYAEANLALGLNAPAETLLKRALSIGEAALKGLKSEGDRLEWSRSEGEIYRDLADLKLRSGDTAGAFAWWEWYKGASVRAASGQEVLPAGDDISRAPFDLSGYSLPPGTALVSYSLSRDSMTAFVFRDGGIRSHTFKLPKDSQLRALTFLSLCADPLADLGTLNAESRRLYDILVAPVEADIQGAAALWIESDGILDRIPVDLLRAPDGRYLGERFEITYSPGILYRSHTRRENLSAASRALIVVAAGNSSPSLPPLPEAAQEGADVAAYFPDANLLSGANATPEEVLRNLRDTSIFHFVGHALTGAGQVGLVLGSETLVKSSDLARLHPANLQLAVLSACGTAQGDDGTFADLNSMARTLAASGVPHTIASRWNVDSVVARQLMRVFYSNLLAGKTPAESLRAAEAAVRSRPGYRQPYYWGSFAVFGSS